MLAIRPTSQFKKDLKKAKKQGRNLEISRSICLFYSERTEFSLIPGFGTREKAVVA